MTKWIDEETRLVLLSRQARLRLLDKQLSAATGLSASTVGRMLGGRTGGSRDNWVKLALALGLELESSIRLTPVRTEVSQIGDVEAEVSDPSAGLVRVQIRGGGEVFVFLLEPAQVEGFVELEMERLKAKDTDDHI